MIVPGMFVCSSFLISVYMFIMSKALFISNTTMIIYTGGAIWLNPFALGLYEVPLSMSLLGFGMGTMLANFHMCGIMLALRTVFNILVRNASPRGPMYCMCLIFNLVRTL